MKKKAVVLLSGGLDSSTCLAIAKAEGYEPLAVTFDYGQRHRVELEAARRVADAASVPLMTVRFDMRLWGGSALTSDRIDVPSAAEAHGGIPVTYVPARNLIFLSFGVSYAETVEARDLYIGVNSLDYSGYPDCRPDFISSFSRTAQLGTRAVDDGWTFQIHAPLQNLRKNEIIRRGLDLGVDYSLTHSCYDPLPDGMPCERCESCYLRTRAFEELGLTDPLLEKKRMKLGKKA
jgi:7-cyano-7-deazaguanine synthase